MPWSFWGFLTLLPSKSSDVLSSVRPALCLPARVLRTLEPDLRSPCSDFPLLHLSSRGTTPNEPHDPTQVILDLLSSTCIEDGASGYGPWAMRSLSESLSSDDFRAYRDGISACVVPVTLARYFARDWDRSGRGPGSR